METEEIIAEPDIEHPETLENETPTFIVYGYYLVLWYIKAYGWYILFAVIAAFFLKSKLQAYLDRQKRRTQNSSHYAQYNAEETFRRQEAMDAARRRLQEQHQNMAEKYSEEQKQKEEEKRKAKLEDWERHQQGKGYRSKVKVQEGSESTKAAKPAAKKTVYRQNDFSPLSGTSSGGGGASFRPARRGGAGGGG